jgi:hypothetical protein
MVEGNGASTNASHDRLATFPHSPNSGRFNFSALTESLAFAVSSYFTANIVHGKRNESVRLTSPGRIKQVLQAVRFLAIVEGVDAGDTIANSGLFVERILLGTAREVVGAAHSLVNDEVELFFVTVLSKPISQARYAVYVRNTCLYLKELVRGHAEDSGSDFIEALEPGLTRIIRH